ncbi:MAG: hypothetical protein GYA14_14385 [Ignavibacteria bacterium]|nr:hypothetical protein [Ignavibacteria bacterium]
MKTYPFIIFLALICISCKKNSSGTTEPESTPPIQTEHFTILLFDNLSNSFATPVLNKLNENYDRILADLELTSIPKVSVQIWNDETHFQNDMKSALGVNYWGSTGYVYNGTNIRVLNRNDLPQTVLHEFAHVVSLQVNRQFGNNPRWFWEAVALYEAGDFVHPRNISYLTEGNFPTLEELNTDFNQGNQKIYQVGYLLSEYIINTWGKSKFVLMIKTNANISTSLGVTTGQFEAGWKEFVTGKYLVGS